MRAATTRCAASAKATRWTLSVRQAVEKVEQQAKKVKGKWSERKRSDTRRACRAPSAPRRRFVRREPSAPSRGPRVIRATRYAVKPMSIDDAALRIEDSAEPFIVFRNPESAAVSIVYRRKDGQLGLIEPD